MSNDKTYNGWSNYETWNVKLWIDNDQGSQGYWEDRASDALESQEDTNDGIELATSELAEQLKTEITEGAPELTGTYSDLLNAALSEVDWYEIAGTMIEEAQQRVMN